MVSWKSANESLWTVFGNGTILIIRAQIERNRFMSRARLDVPDVHNQSVICRGRHHAGRRRWRSADAPGRGETTVRTATFYHRGRRSISRKA